jgi:hypothetical protein
MSEHTGESLAEADVRAAILRVEADLARTPVGADVARSVADIRTIIAAVRTPQPVQVEVTDDMVERLARALFARSKEGRDGFTWPLNGDHDRQRNMNDARKLLVRVLGGGE